MAGYHILSSDPDALPDLSILGNLDLATLSDGSRGLEA